MLYFFSGAKDSTFAVYKAIASGYDVRYLLTFIPDAIESTIFNYANTRWTHLQAKSMNIPIIVKRVGIGQEEDILRKTLESIYDEVRGIVLGSFDNREKRRLIEKTCEPLGIDVITPHWMRGTSAAIEEMIFSGFEMIITKVDGESFDHRWLGRRLDMQALEELEHMGHTHGIHLAGKEGEYESFVLDGPLFSKKINILSAKKVWDGVRGTYFIERAELSKK